MARKHLEKGLRFAFEKQSEERERLGIEKLVLMKGEQKVGKVAYYRPEEEGPWGSSKNIGLKLNFGCSVQILLFFENDIITCRAGFT